MWEDLTTRWIINQTQGRYRKGQGGKPSEMDGRLHTVFKVKRIYWGKRTAKPGIHSANHPVQYVVRTSNERPRDSVHVFHRGTSTLRAVPIPELWVREVAIDVATLSGAISFQKRVE